MQEPEDHNLCFRFIYLY